MYGTIFSNLASKPGASASNNTAASVSYEVDYELMNDVNEQRQEEIALDHALSTLDNMDALVTLAEAHKDNGLSTDGLAFYHNQATALLQSIGVDGDQVVPSMESFNSSQQANIENLEFSLAGFKETMEKAWDAVIKFIKDMVNKVKAFFTKLMDKMPKLKKAAEAMKEKAGDTSGSPENNKVKVGSAVKNIVNGDEKTADVNAITDALDKLTKIKVADEFIKLADADDFKKLESEDATGIAALTPGNLGIEDTAINNVMTAGLVDVGDDVPEGYGLSKDDYTISHLELPGNTSLVVSHKNVNGADGTDNDATVSALKRFSSLKFGSKSRKKKFDVDSDLEVETLSTGDVENICDAVISFAEMYEKETDAIKDGQKKADALTKLADKIKGNAGKSDYADVKEHLNAARGAFTTGATLALNPTRDIVAVGYTLGSSALTYCGKSLSEYKDD